MPRPANANRSGSAPQRKQKVAPRIPIGGHRDLLNVIGKDPAYYYRFIVDSSEEGGKVVEAKMAGYEMAMAKDHTVPPQHVFESTQYGGIIRYPCKNGDFLYLMRLRQELREEDLQNRESELGELEGQIYSSNDRKDLGQYSSENNRITHNMVRHSEDQDD